MSTSLSTQTAVDEFLTSRQDKSPRTIEWYSGHLKPFITDFSELPLTPEPLERHIFTLDTTPEYRHGRYRAIKALYRFLEKRHRLPVDPQWGIINPIKQVNPPRVLKKLPASLSMPELEKVVQATQNPLEEALIQLIIDCGMRVGEIVSIERENIGEEFVTVTGKTGERQVSLSPSVRDILLCLVSSGKVFIRGQGSKYRGKPHNEDSLYRIVNRLLKRAGIKKRHMGLHLFRHSCGRHLVAGGADLVTVQQLFGHQNITTTRIYTELAGEDVHKTHLRTSPLRQLELNHKNGK